MKILNYLLMASLSLFIFASCEPDKPEEPNGPDTENPENPENPEKPTPPEEEIPETTYRLESEFCDYNYWGHFEDFPGDTDNVILMLGNVEHENFYVTSEGELIVLSLYVPHAENPIDASVIAGEYKYDNTASCAEMTVSAIESSRLYYVESTEYEGWFDAEDSTYFSNVELTIEEKDGGHIVKALLTYENGETMYVTYEGVLTFDNKYEKSGWPQIDSNKDFVCGYGEVSYYGNSEYVLDIMSGGDPWESMSWGDRDRLQIELVAYSDDKTGVASGTYTIGEEGPGSVAVGDFVYYSDMAFVVGSRYFYLDTATYEQVIGYLVGGTLVVERDGENYKLALDAVDANGYTVKATYEGTLPVIDQTDTGQY